MELRTILFVLASIYAGALAGPLNARSRCSRQCTDTTKFNYIKGTTYTYHYQGDVITKVKGASDEHSGMHMRATTEIEVLDKCDFALKLSDVTLEESDPRNENSRYTASNSEIFRRALEQKPMHFSFQDGRIEDVCADEEDPTWVANIKKAVLSSFQNTMEDLQIDTKVSESDITGQCDTEYKVARKGWRSFTVTKSKDLHSCTDRHGYRTALQSAHYRVPAKIQSLPITKGSHTCQQTYHSSGRMLKAECVESHVFRPFSKESNGAVTDARHTLEFVRETQGVSLRPTSGRRTTLKFEHEIPQTDKNSDMEPSLATLREICSQTSTSVRPETPGLFARLVYQLKEMNERTIRDLHSKVSRSQVCGHNHESAKKFLHDAIPMVGTTASVRMITELVNRRHIKDSEAEAWLSSLSFVKNPTRDMISAAAVLLQREPTKTVFLSVSAMVNTYCKTHSDCGRDAIIQGVAQSLQGRLNYNCKAKTPRERDTILVVLKSLGNMGHASRVTDTLNRCMLEPSNPVDIRLAAIDAFRRQPCDADRSRVMDVFTTIHEDVEVRIAAYLAVMQCATHEVLATVQRTLETEEVNQVGSFVWTHLTNLRESSDLHKQTVRRILEDQTLKKQFNLDKTKFSRNFEGSFFSESLNTGAKVESNLIFSPKSYLPRSAMLNLTFDLFGESVNLLEVGGRVEGLERLFENYFGPKGYFGNNLKDIRPKRSVPNDVNSLHNKFADEADDAVRGSLYFKVFGHEINFIDLMTMQKQASQLNILEILIMMAKEHDINYNKSFMFLDTSMTIPTVTGLPIKLSVNGTATVSLKVKGKLDMRKLGSSPRSLDVNGYFKPSAAVELSTMMGVDAFVTKTGIKMVSTLHSSSEIDGKIMIQDSKIVQFKMNAPKDKIEILNAETKFFTLHRQVEREQKMLSVNPIVKEKCTGEGLSKVLGVKICGHVQYPGQSLTNEVPFYPLTGPSKLNIGLLKTDAHTSYQFEAKMLTQKTRRNHHTDYSHVARLAFDTPGSSVDRKFEFDFELNRGEKKINFNMITPWKKAGLNGEIINLPDEKRASVRFTIDNEHVYSAKTGVTIQRGSGFTKYTPTLEIRIPGRHTISVQGGLDYQEDRRLDVDLSMNNLLENPVIFRGSIQKESRRHRERYNTDLELHSPILKAKLGGYVERKNDGYRTRLAIDYGKGKKPEHRLVLNYKMRQHVTPSLRRIVMDTAVQTTQYPDYSFSSRVELQKAAGHAEASVRFEYGDDHNNELKKIDAAAIFKYENKDGKFNLDSTLKFKYPMMKYDWDMKLSHNHESSVVKTSAKLKNHRREMLNFDMSLLDQSTDLKKYIIDVSLQTESRDMRFYQHLDERQHQEYHQDMIVQWNRNKALSTRAMYKREAGRHSMTLDIRMPDSMPINVNAQANMNLRDFSTTGSLSYAGRDYSVNLFYKQEPQQHTAGGKLIIPHLRPMVANIEIKPSFNDMSLIASAEYGQDIYRVKAEYSALFESSKQMVRGNTELMYPGRRMTGLIAAKHLDGEISAQIECKWDASRDTSKAIVFDIEYKFPSYTHHTGRLDVRIPGKQLKGKFALQKEGSQYKAVGELQWNLVSKMTFNAHLSSSRGWRTYTINGGVLFTSPFQYMEKLGGSFSYDTRGEQHTARGEIVLSETKKINTDFFLNTENQNNFEGRWTTRTPYESMKVINLHLKHLREYEQFSTIVSGKINDKTVHGEITLRTPDAIEGSAKLQLPIKYLEKLGFSFYHHSTGQQLTNRAEVVWSPTEKISIDSLFHIESLTKANGHLQTSTPFKGFRSFNVRMSHEISGNVFSCKGHGDLEGKAIEYEVVAKNLGTSNRNSLEGTVRLKTPIAMFEDLGVSVKYSDDGTMYSASADAKWNPQSQISSSIMLSHRGSGYQFNNEGTFQLKTPFTNVHHIGSTWKLMISSTEVISNGDVSFNGLRYTLSLGAKHEKTNMDRQGSLNFAVQTPYMRDIKTDFKVTLRGNNYFETNVLMSIDNERKMEMEATIGVNKLDIDGHLKADISGMFNIPAFSASVKTLWNASPHSLHINAEWSPEKKITMDGSLEISSFDKIVGSVQFSSPMFQKLGFVFNHQKKKMEYTTRMAIQWAQSKSITSLSKLKMEYGKFTGSLNLQTPFECFTSLTLTTEHRGHLTSFSNNHNVDVVVNGKRTTLTNNFVYYGPQLIRGSSRVRSMMFNFDASLNHQYRNKNMVSSFEVNPSSGKKYSAVLNVEHDNGFKMMLEFNSPFDEVRDSKLTISHSGSFPHTHSTIIISTSSNTGKITADGSVIIDGLNNIKINTQMTTPFDSVRNVALSSNYYSSGHVHRCQSTFTKSGEKYEVDATIDLGDKLTISVKTPWYALKEVKASFEKRGSFPYITTNAQMTAETDNGKFVVNGHILMNSYHAVSINVEAESPYTTSPMSFSFDHGKDQQMWRTTIIARTASGQYEYKSKFQFKKAVFMNIEIKTPSQFLKSFTFLLNHDGSATHFDHKLLLEYNVFVARVRLENTWKVRGIESISGDMKLTSPIRDWEHVAFVVQHGRHGQEWISTADFDYTPGRRVQIRSGLKMGYLKKIDITLRTPFHPLRSAGISMSHEGQLSSFENKVTVNVNHMRLDGTLKMDAFRELKATYRAGSYGKLWSMEINQNMANKQFTIDYAIKFNNRHLCDMNANIDLNAMVKATIRGNINGKSVVIVTEHEGEGLRFRNSLKVNIGTISAESVLDVNRMSSLSFKTQITNLFSTPIIASLDQKVHSGQWNLKAEYNKYVLSALVNIRDNLDIDLSFTSPSRHVKSITIKMENQGDINDLAHSMVITYRGESLKNIETKLLLKGFDYAEGSLQLRGFFRQDVSANLAHRLTSSMKSTNVNVNLGQTSYFTLSSRFQKTSGVRYNLDLNGPCRFMKNFRVEFDLTGSMKNFNSKVSVNHNMMSKPFLMEVDFKMPIDMKVRITPPCSHVDVLEATLKHGNTGYHRYSTMMSFTFNNNVVRAQSEMNLINLGNLNGEMSITTPFESARQLKLNFNHQMHERNIQSYALLESVSHGRFEFSTTITSKKGRFIVKTPFAGYEELGLTFDHEGEAGNFKNEIAVFATGRKVSMTTELKTYPTVQGKFFLSTPFKNWKRTGFTVKHANDAYSAKTDLSVDVYNKVISVDYSHKLETDKEIQLNVRTPFAGYENTFLYLKHSGSSYQFDTRLTLQYSSSKRMEATVGFYNDGYSNLRFDITTKTPCPWMKSSKISYDHQAIATNNFRCNIVVENNGKSIVGNLNVKEQSGKSIIANVKTPFRRFEQMSFSLNHRGDGLRQFNTKTVVEYMTGKNIVMEVSHRSYNFKNVETSIMVKTPCQYAKSTYMKYKHNIDDNGLSIHTEQGIMERKIVLDINCKYTPTFDATFNLATPFKGFEKNGLAITFNGNWRRFSTNLNIEYEAGVIESGITFLNMDMHNVELTIVTKTPYTEMITFLYKHKGKLSNFEVNADMHYKSKKASANILFKLSDPVDCKITIKTPFQAYEDLYFSLSHNRDTQLRCTTKTVLQYQTGKQIVSVLTLENNGISDFALTLSTKTPFLPEITGTFKNQADIGSIQSMAKVTYGRKEIDGEMKFRKFPFYFDLKAKTPFNQFEDMYLTASYNPSRHMASMALQYMTGKRISANAVAVYDESFKNVDVDVTINHPFTTAQEIKASYKHDLTERRLHASSTVKYGLQKQIGIYVEMERGNSLSASVKVMTPFVKFEKIIVSLMHTGDLKKFTSTANIEYMTGSKIEALLEFDNGNSQTGSLIIKTPFYGYETISARYNHVGQLNNFQTNVLVKYRLGREIEAKLKFQPARSVFELKTPFNGYEIVRVEYNHNGNAGNFRTNAIARSMYKSIEFDLTFTPKKSQLVVKTPFRGFEKNVINYEFSGVSTNFNADTLIKLGNSQLSATLFFSPDNIKFVANTPFSNIRTMMATMKTHGSALNFNSESRVILNNNEKMHLTVGFYASSRISGQLSLRTPYHGIENVKMVISHEGNMQNFKTSGSFQNSRYGTTEFDLTFSPRQSIISIRMPVSGFENLEMKYKIDGEITNFRATSSIQYMTGKMLQADITFRPSQMTIQFATPFRGFEKMSMSYQFSGHLTSFQLQTHIDVMHSKRIVADLEFRPENAKLTIRTPFNQFESLEASYQYADSKITSFIQYMTDKRISLDADFKAYEVNVMLRTPFQGFESLSTYWKYGQSRINGHIQYMSSQRMTFAGNFRRSPLSMNIAVKTPFTGFETLSFTINHQGSYENMNSRASVQYMTGQRIDGIFQLTTRPNQIQMTTSVFTPYRIARETTLSFKYDATNVDKKAEASLKYGVGKVIRSQIDVSLNDGFDGKITIATPFPGFEELYASQHFEGSIREFTSTTKFQYATGKLITNILKVAAKSALDFTVDSTLTSPCRYLPKTGFTYKHLIHHKKIVFMLKADTLEVTLKASKDDNLELHMELKSKFGIIKQVGIYIRGGGEIKMSNALAKAYYNSKYIKIEGKYDVNNLNNLRGSARVDSTLVNRPIILSLTHAGTFKSFKTAIVADRYKMEVVFNHAASTTGKLTVVFSDRTIAFEFRHQGQWKHFATDASVKCNEHILSGHVDFTKSRRNVVANINVKTPFRGWEVTSFKLRHNGVFSEFKSKAILVKQGQKNIVLDLTYKHGAEGIIAFRSPYYRFENIVANFKKLNGGYTGSVSWAPYKEIRMTITGSYGFASRTNMQLQGLIKILTPFTIVRELTLESSHSHSNTQLTNKMKVILNGEIYLDTSMEGKLMTTGLTGKISVQSPYPIELSTKVVATDAEKSIQGIVNWDTTTEGRKVELLLQYKDGSSYYRTKHDGIIKVTLPWRICAITTTLESSKYQSKHKTELIWDQARGKKVSYAMTFHDRSRSYQRQWDADLELSSPVRTIKTIFNHNDNGRRFLSEVQLLWDANRNENKKMGVKTLYENYGLSHKLELTLSHPKMSKDITIRNELTLNRSNFLYSGKTELEYSVDPSEKLVVSGKLNKIARGRANNYTMTMHVSHPKSLVDMELTSHIGKSESKVSAGTEMKYLTARRIRKNLFLMAEIDKIKKTMNMHMHTPLKSVDLVGQMNELETGYKFHLNNLIDGEIKMRTELEINTKMPLIDLVIRNKANPENMFHAYAKIVNGREVKIESYRQHDGLKTTDGLFAVHKNTSRLFHTRAHWNRNIISDMVGYATEKFEESRAESATMMDEVKQGIEDEMRVRNYYIHNNLPDVSAAQKYISTELTAFQEDADVILNEFRHMYENNDFFMRDIYEGTSNIIEYLNNQMRVISFQVRRRMDDLRRVYSLSMARLSRKVDGYLADVRDYIVDIVLRFRPAWQKYAYAAIRQYLVASQKANHNYQQMMEIAESYKDSFVNYLDDHFDFITYRMEPYLVKLQELRTMLRSQLSEEQQDRYIDMAIQKISSVMRGLKSSSQEWMSAALAKYSEVKDDIRVTFSKKLENVIGHDLTQKAMRKLTSLYTQVEEMTTHFELNQRIKLWAKKAYHNAIDLVKDQVHEITRQYIQIDRSGFTVYKPREGEIQAELYLPLAMDINWDKLRNFEVETLTDEANRIYRHYLPKMDSDYSIWDTYYKYKPSSDVFNWIPPYRAHASLLGNEHYTTFDGKTFDFAGSCTYLLARDFVHGRFTILANYDRGVRKSITVLSNKKEIEVFHDGKVTIDGRQTELPYNFVNTTVITDGNRITIENALGVKVMCDLKMEMCTFEISGWYQGKTAGLLGTYDNEVSNDFLTSEKSKTSDLDVFARSWQIGSCSGYQNYASQESVSAGEQGSVCSELFSNRDSHFRPCYKIVSPINYHKMCMKDVSNIFGAYAVNKKACAVAELYRAECQAAGVALSLPKSCKSCKSGETEIRDGETSNVNAIQSADVIFVIEEKQCNKGASRKLPHLVSQINNALGAKGLRNNRFALVGFGGENIHNEPHRHTLMNQIMNDAGKFHTAVEALTFIGGENRNVFSAVREAAKYPFRAGASKIIVAMPCSTHSHDSSSGDMSSFLAKNDISFHVLAGYDFTLRSRSPKSNFIFGADRQTAYTSKDVYQLQGDQTLFNMLVMPKDKCAKLALDRQGSIFNARKLTEGRVNTQKFFLDVFARRIAATAQPKRCQICKCTDGRTECTPCQSEYSHIQVLVPATKLHRTARSLDVNQFEMKFQDA